MSATENDADSKQSLSEYEVHVFSCPGRTFFGSESTFHMSKGSVVSEGVDKIIEPVFVPGDANTIEREEGWGDYESNCSETCAQIPENVEMTSHVEMQSSMSIDALSVPHITAKTEPEEKRDMENVACINNPSEVDMSKATAEILVVSGTSDIPKPKKVRQIKRVQFGEDKITMYETSNSPNRVLDHCNIAEEKTTLTYADGSVYEGQVMICNSTLEID